ncbi:MAG: hypothetical protein WBD41_24465 [Rhodococcus sp. (in: high G+C Gram-positive bacteria)]|uniref:hypothetical protein n=1 Tax=Rhodococcus sp. EPR-157 TaxID=1813677 RepID=UPI0007BAE0C8|nr:hypothetical protein [Rhodococcus sp. EPR-157]KZF10494.1 hypothetical protein A2J03_00545 [Rhodococcus sp. EPR-157]
MTTRRSIGYSSCDLEEHRRNVVARRGALDLGLVSSADVLAVERRRNFRIVSSSVVVKSDKSRRVALVSST